MRLKATSIDHIYFTRDQIPKAIIINNNDRYHFYHRKILLRYPANFTSIFKNGLLIPKPVDHIH